MRSRESFRSKCSSASRGKSLRFVASRSPWYDVSSSLSPWPHADLQAPAHSCFMLNVCKAIFSVKLRIMSLHCWKILHQRYTNCILIMLFDNKNSLSSLSLSFMQQSKSHTQPWIYLTFRSHNSPLLLFFLSTGFKSQAGAWERKTVCWNLHIVFSSPLSKP